MNIDFRGSKLEEADGRQTILPKVDERDRGARHRRANHTHYTIQSLRKSVSNSVLLVAFV